MIARCLDWGRRPVARMPPGKAMSIPLKMSLAWEIILAYRRARREIRAAPIGEAVRRLRALPLARAKAGSPAVLPEARRLGAAVQRTLALLPGDTRCLAQSLVLTQLLARRGITARLVIGARADPEFIAHAWVEHDGH